MCPLKQKLRQSGDSIYVTSIQFACHGLLRSLPYVHWDAVIYSGMALSYWLPANS